jgi:hypothetical protein
MVAVEGLTPFHRALSTHRDRYNAAFRQARTLDAAGFLAQLRDAVGPVVDACETDPVPVTDALVDLAVALAGRRADGVWPLLATLAPFVAAAPRRVPVAVANALHHLSTSPTGRPAEWVAAMGALGGRTDDVAELLEAGSVAAWRCGLAQLRRSAVEVARGLRPELLEVTLPGLSTMDIPRLAVDPWLDPAARPGLRVVRRVGAFRGFGGVFRRPPTVSVSDGHWYASDGDGAWRVHADRFGVAFRRIGALPAPGGAGNLSLSHGRVSADGAVLDVPELAEASSWASCGDTLAATTPYTHGILFVART